MIETIFKPTEHPLLPLPAVELVEAAMREPELMRELAREMTAREERIKKSVEDRYGWGFELEHWADADLLLFLNEKLYCGGGSRSGKTDYTVKRAIEAGVTYGNGKIWMFHDSERSSIHQQQSRVWDLLPMGVKERNSARAKRLEKVVYKAADGFADKLLILPNGTQFHFLTYGQDPKDYQGWELGADMRTKEWKWKHRGTREVAPEGQLMGEWERARIANSQSPIAEETKIWERIMRWGMGAEHTREYLEFACWAMGQGWRRIENIGALCDENLTLTWLDTVKLRLATRNAKMVWPYTPIMGITPAVKEFRGAAKLVESRECAELKGTRFQNLPDGHMPYVERLGTDRSAAIYFPGRMNPFSDYARLVRDLEGKSIAERRCKLTGFAEEIGTRAFPKFSGVNVIEESELPAVGTNYMVTDPAGSRNWATIWARVAPGNPGKVFIYREWPDVPRHGEWAVPDENDQNPNPDGVAGPAQKTLGYGIVEYKKLFLEQETIGVRATDGTVRAIKAKEADAYRMAGLEVFKGGTNGLSGSVRPTEYVEETRRDGSVVLRERIFQRFIDPRAGRNQKQAEHGGTCIQDEMMAEQVKRGSGEVEGPRMLFDLASGVDIQEGIMRINELLFWNEDADLCPLLNEPLLYVTRSCRNVIWTLSNYTALGGEKAGCKDFADLLRYLALAQLRYIAAEMLKTRGGGWSY